MLAGRVRRDSAVIAGLGAEGLTNNGIPRDGDTTFEVGYRS